MQFDANKLLVLPLDFAKKDVSLGSVFAKKQKLTSVFVVLPFAIFPFHMPLWKVFSFCMGGMKKGIKAPPPNGCLGNVVGRLHLNPTLSCKLCMI